jgi:hypothetical protein
MEAGGKRLALAAALLDQKRMHPVDMGRACLGLSGYKESMCKPGLYCHSNDTGKIR